MKYPERTKIVEGLPFESRLGYIAYCVERCLDEARRHPAAAEQLQRLPLLSDGLQMVWDRAERGINPDPERVNAVIDHLGKYETPAPSMEDVVYNADVTLVQAARTLMKGMQLLKEPGKETPRYVAGALEGPYQAVALVYADYNTARNAEAAIADKALVRLQEWGDKPFSRTVFDGIPEWTRGELSKKYSAGKIKGTAEDED